MTTTATGDDDDDDFGPDFLIPIDSGIKCQNCDSMDAIVCTLYDYEAEKEIIEHLCDEHAKEAGYCMGCGQFSAGIESFDFDHPGYCENCWDQIMADSGDFYDDDDYDYIDF